MRAPAPLWLQSDAEGCSSCPEGDGRLVCRAQTDARTCPAPQLVGPPEQLRQVMQTLDREVIDPALGRGIVALQWVRALRLTDGEAELVVTFSPGCGGGRQLMQQAFEALRRLLPETDIYVLHRAAELQDSVG